MIAGKDKQLLLLEKSALEFGEKELMPEKSENDKYPFAPFYESPVKKAYELGFFSIMLPEESGGLGRNITNLSVLVNAISKEDASLAGIILCTAASQEIILEAGKTELLPDEKADVFDYISGFQLFTSPLQEAPLCTAKKSGEDWLLSGEARYVVMGGFASKAVIASKINEEEGFSWFLVNLKQKGFEISDTIFSLGLHACPAVDMKFENIKVELLSSKGKKIFDTLSAKLSVAGAAMEAGIMRGSLKEALAYAKKREQGGRKIIKWSEMEMILADMAVSTTISEMAVNNAMKSVDDKEKGFSKKALAASVFVSDAACDVTSSGIQVLGGVGYMKDYGQEKRFRDAQHLKSLFGIHPLRKKGFTSDFL